MPAQLVSLNECRQAEHAQRVAQALTLRADGKSLRDIAEKLNISVSTARQYWREALASLHSESADYAREIRATQLAQLEELTSKWSTLANQPHIEGADRAAAIVIRSLESQAKLLGLDKIDSNAKPVPTELDIGEALKSKAVRDGLRRLLDEADAAATE